MISEEQQSPSPSSHSECTHGAPLFRMPITPKKPHFILPSHQQSIRDAARPIFEELGKSLVMYVRGGAFVEVAENQLKKHLELREIRPHQFASRVEAVGQLYKWIMGKEKPVLIPTPCSKTTAELLMGTAEALELLPKISMVVDSPIIKEGEDSKPYVLACGYHKFGGGIVVTRGEQPPDVPFSEATDALTKLIQDFDFETPADMTRALAIMLTPALLWGGFLQNACIPMFLVEANDSQAGKGYLLHLIATIYGETLIPRAPRKGGVGSFDEDFNAALLKGKPLILFDNLRDAIDSPHIESFITARGSFSVRTPHRAAVDIDVSNYVLLATSNGFGTTKDLENRLLRLRILKRPSSHRFKSFNGKDVLTHVQEKQSYYLGCVFSIVRYWLENGKQRTGEMRHSFRDWAQTLDWILQNAFKDKISGGLMDGVRADEAAGEIDLFFS